MGHKRQPEKFKLISGLLYADPEILSKVKPLLEREFGKIDFESEELDFTQTDYYRQEMGEGLKRRFLGFSKPVDPARAYRAKLKTNSIERRLSKNGNRAVNIDPGILSLSKLILFTTKDYSHRIFINDGIFAEVTLLYENDRFKPCPWTYPDYRQDLYSDILCRMRKDLKNPDKGAC